LSQSEQSDAVSGAVGLSEWHEQLRYLSETEAIVDDFRNWGYTIYRTAYGPSTDQRWQQLLEQIRTQAHAATLSVCESTADDPALSQPLSDAFSISPSSLSITLPYKAQCAMSQLPDLSAELTLNIIDHFDAFWRASPDIFDIFDDRTKALLNLCLTCRCLRNIAQPVLFEVIGIYRQTEITALHTLSPLVRTFSARLDLAQKTRSLLLKLGGLKTGKRGKGKTTFYGHLTRFFQGAEQLVAEDLLCYLVPLLQNVTSLDIRTDDYKEDLWRSIRESQNCGEGVFPKIQSLSVRSYLGRDFLQLPCECLSNHANIFGANVHGLSVNIADFAPFITQTTLRTFSMNTGAILPYKPNWILHLKPQSVYMRELELTSCDILLSALTHLV
jgi:hypothetical protein